MSTTDKFVMAILAVAILIILAFIPRAPSDPCGTAEFAPDTPTHIKEQCRRVKT